jgi:hypothetical protein
LLAREVVCRLDYTSDTVVEIAPARVVCAEDGKGEARGEFETEVDLAVLSRVFCAVAATDTGCELLVEVYDCG